MPDLQIAHRRRQLVLVGTAPRSGRPKERVSSDGSPHRDSTMTASTARFGDPDLMSSEGSVEPQCSSTPPSPLTVRLSTPSGSASKPGRTNRGNTGRTVKVSVTAFVVVDDAFGPSFNFRGD
jgi:hypothetical protein